MKVLEVNVDDNGMGGVYSFVRNVIKNRDKTIKIDIATLEPFESEGNVQELRRYDCVVYYIGREGSQLLKQVNSFFRLVHFLKRTNYDVVHIHSDLSIKLFIYGLASKIAGVKKILLHSHASGAEGRRLWLKNYTQRAFGKTLKYIGTNFLACSDLASIWMYPNIDIEKVIIVNNAIDLEKFRYNPQIRKKVRDELGLDKNYVVGHVGRFSNVKNQCYIIDVFCQVKKRIPLAKLLLVGDGEMMGACVEKVKCFELSDDVIFWGTTQDVASLYQCMDVLAMPSIREGFPIVGVEAQASGLPVLFSDHITKTGKLTDVVEFLPIDDSSISLWVNRICDLMNYNRQDTFHDLKSRKFDISDTVRFLSELYLS